MRLFCFLFTLLYYEMKGSSKKKLKSCEAKQLQVTLVLLTSKERAVQEALRLQEHATLPRRWPNPVSFVRSFVVDVCVGATVEGNAQHRCIIF